MSEEAKTRDNARGGGGNTLQDSIVTFNHAAYPPSAQTDPLGEGICKCVLNDKGFVEP